MTGRNYRWHKRWVVDLTTRCATHDSGVAIDFAYVGKIPSGRSIADIDFDTPEIGCVSLPDGKEAWIGGWRGGLAGCERWLKTQPMSDEKSKQARVARLMREAGEVWARAKKNED